MQPIRIRFIAQDEAAAIGLQLVVMSTAIARTVERQPSGDISAPPMQWFNGCLVVVTEVWVWVVISYLLSPRVGDGERELSLVWVRLGCAEIEDTGGVAVWTTENSETADDESSDEP